MTKTLFCLFLLLLLFVCWFWEIHSPSTWWILRVPEDDNDHDPSHVAYRNSWKTALQLSFQKNPLINRAPILGSENLWSSSPTAHHRQESCGSSLQFGECPECLLSTCTERSGNSFGKYSWVEWSGFTEGHSGTDGFLWDFQADGGLQYIIYYIESPWYVHVYYIYTHFFFRCWNNGMKTCCFTCSGFRLRP